MMRKMTMYVKEAKSQRPIHDLEDLLLKEPGVERALVDVEDGEVKLELDETKVKESQIIRLIKEAGFHLE
ncbi:heavy-metal-associated domain-containing protein [Planococcus rifietoensis]|uniref:heavy-metal-associated domain-containing protein n=2 Tax=Planococcus rifietoensis TaxID=200991 RepID=UPI00384F2462